MAEEKKSNCTECGKLLGHNCYCYSCICKRDERLRELEGRNNRLEYMLTLALETLAKKGSK